MKKTIRPSAKKIFVSYGLHIWFALIVLNMVVVYAVQTHARAQTCFTVPQVQTDSRCLYILSNKVYDNGATRANPHHGHPCGTDVTSVIPSFHTDSPATYLTPNYIGDICVAPTPTTAPTAAPTAVPTSVPTPVPTASISIVPSPQCLGGGCTTPLPTQVMPSSTQAFPTLDPQQGGGGGNGGFLGLIMQLLLAFLAFLAQLFGGR